jgi:regulator of sirC expression with transglutaminase-like and TPR domain
MRELTALLTGSDESVDLDVAALQLATIEYPNITVEPFRLLLDSYAAELSARVQPETSGEDFVALTNEYLFDELGFEGNAGDYYDPANSCLNEVLTARKGIPITLSIVYMELGRRLDRPISGIGLPGHFLVQYDDGEFSAYVDPFNGGELLFETECFELARRVTGMHFDDDPQLLQPATNRQIVLRMLNNLRTAYLMREDAAKLLRVLDLLIQAEPDSPDEYRQRGLVRGRMQLYQPARADLLEYLRLAPSAPDRNEVLTQIAAIEAWLKHLQ